MNHEYKDMFGRDIKVGDYIIYAALADRSGVLRAGQVIELTETKEDRWETKKKDPKIRARSWNNFRQEGWFNGQKYTRSGRQKDVTLSFLDRIVVVSPDTLSEKVRLDLEGPVHSDF